MLTFRDTGLPASTGHVYFVRAYDQAGRESADSVHVSMTTAAAAVPTGSCTKSGSGWNCILYAQQGIQFRGGTDPKVVDVKAEGGDFQFLPADGHAYYGHHFGVDTPSPAACMASSNGPWDDINMGDLVNGAIGCRRESFGNQVYSFVKVTDGSRKGAASPSIEVRLTFVSAG